MNLVSLFDNRAERNEQNREYEDQVETGPC